MVLQKTASVLAEKSGGAVVLRQMKTQECNTTSVGENLDCSSFNFIPLIQKGVPLPT